MRHLTKTTVFTYKTSLAALVLASFVLPARASDLSPSDQSAPLNQEVIQEAQRITLAEPESLEPTTDIPTQTKPFAAGSWAFHSYGAAVFGDDAGELYLGHAGIGFYVEDEIAVVFEVVGGGFDGKSQSGKTGNDGAVGGANLLIRHHFYHDEHLTLFFEGGAGILIFEAPFPADGTHGRKS